MNERTLNVELRTGYGKNESGRLRVKGFIPAVLYSHGKTESIKVPLKAFTSIFKGRISESVLIDLNIADKPGDAQHKVFVKDYNIDPVSNQIMHIDFYKVTADEKIRTVVKLEITGAPVGVKEGGVLEIFERELEIECLPKDMPERVAVDVSNLAIGQSFRVNDIKIGESVKFLGLPERPIASVVIPHVKEEAVEAKEGVEGAEEGKEVQAEGEETKAKDKEKAKE
ncbi:MAG: 50S ribosomal protein L25 [Spirochaetota bacterium]